MAERQPWTLPEDCARRDAALAEVKRALQDAFPDRWEQIFIAACYPKGRIALVERVGAFADRWQIIPDTTAGDPFGRVLVEIFVDRRRFETPGLTRELVLSLTVEQALRAQRFIGGAGGPTWTADAPGDEDPSGAGRHRR